MRAFFTCLTVFTGLLAISAMHNTSTAEDHQAALAAKLSTLQNAHPQLQGFAASMIYRGTLSTAAVGQANPNGQDMTAETPVRLASITKTSVAAAIIRLVEQQKLDLDQQISRLISNQHRDILLEAGYQPTKITVRHLLLHASGLADHAQTSEFIDIAINHREHVFSRTDQLQLLARTTKPIAQPGATYSYSDTGYILLGEIIERITGENLATAVKALNKFNQIGLGLVIWDGEPETASQPPRAHQWLGDINAHGVNHSIDSYGGGGLIASSTDLARYYHALFDGQIFDHAHSLELMKTGPQHPANSPYRYGLFVENYKGYTLYSHSGFWGTLVINVPDLQLTIATISLNQNGFSAIKDLSYRIIDEIAAQP